MNARDTGLGLASRPGRTLRQTCDEATRAALKAGHGAAGRSIRTRRGRRAMAQVRRWHEPSRGLAQSAESFVISGLSGVTVGMRDGDCE